MPTDAIPLKFQKVSGILSHTFRVKTNQYLGPIDQLVALQVFILERDGWVQRFAPVSTFPAEVEALAILCDVDGETERQGRYINIHSAYEAVVPQRSTELSAIRHALAHPVTALTRPSVRAALLGRFGTLHIDLCKYDHQKIVYCSMAAMLIAIDHAIYQSFSTRAKELVRA